MIASLRLKLGSLLRNGVVRSVGVLVGGTAFAQALMVLALPLLTRLYTPDDFSVLAIYASLLGLIGTVACLRLDIAIPLPEQDEDAANILALALASATAVALLTGVLVFALGEEIAALVRRPDVVAYLWLLPIGVWFTGLYAGLQYWSTRKKQFPLIARTRMAQSIGAIGVQTSLGFASAGPIGLLLGQVVNSGAGIAGLARKLWRGEHAPFRAIGLRRMGATLREYQRFPKFSTLEAFANTGGIQIPIIIIAALAAGPEAGFLLLATRVMAAPMGLIGGAVAQVYLSKAPEENRAGRLATFTTGMIGGLFKTGVGPLIFAGIVSPFAFPIVFGAQWERAGEIVSFMTPWFVMQFVTSPVSMALHVLEHQLAAFHLQVFGLVLRVGAVVVAAALADTGIIEIYAASGFVFYLVYFVVVARVVGIRAADLVRECRAATAPLLFWTVLALIAAASLYALNHFGLLANAFAR